MPGLFESFISAKRRSENIRADLQSTDDGIPDCGGFIYGGDCFIEDSRYEAIEVGKYYVDFGNVDYALDDLAECELLLFAFHYVPECAPADSKLSGADLAAFIEGHCAGNNIRAPGYVALYSGVANVAPQDVGDAISRAASTFKTYVVDWTSAEARNY